MMQTFLICHGKDIMKKLYPALIHKDPGSDYGLSFPDFPGCVTAAENLDELYQLASEALGLHIDGMEQDGDEFPEASSIETALADKEEEGFVAVSMIEARLPAKSKRYNVMLPEDLVSDIDARTKNRSAYITEAIRSRLEVV